MQSVIEKDEKLNSLNMTLTNVQNDLMVHALDRREQELENAVDFINDLADDEIIDIECGSCEPEDGEWSADHDGDDDGSSDAD